MRPTVHAVSSDRGENEGANLRADRVPDVRRTDQLTLRTAATTEYHVFLRELRTD